MLAPKAKHSNQLRLNQEKRVFSISPNVSYTQTTKDITNAVVLPNYKVILQSLINCKIRKTLH